MEPNILSGPLKEEQVTDLQDELLIYDCLQRKLWYLLVSLRIGEVQVMLEHTLKSKCSTRLGLMYLMLMFCQSNDTKMPNFSI